MASLNERHALSEFPQSLAREIQRAGIAIDGQQLRCRISIQQRFCMPAESDRRVDDCSVFAVGPEKFDDLF